MKFRWNWIIEELWVNCETIEQATQLLISAKEKGFNWMKSKEDSWNKYKDKTCYFFFYGHLGGLYTVSKSSDSIISELVISFNDAVCGEVKEQLKPDNTKSRFRVLEMDLK